MPNQHTKYLEKHLYSEVIAEIIKVGARDPYGFNSTDIDIIRIESPSTPGTPDINVCIRSFDNKHQEFIGKEFWIECKVAPNDLGSYQKAWIKKRHLAGGRVFVINRKNETLFHLDGISLCSLNAVIREIYRRMI